MDKLKEQLAVVKEHSFWILCGGILLVSLVSWYKSTGDLQTEQKKYKGEIEAAVSAINAVRQTPDHPNESTNKGMDAVTLSFGEDVYQAWARLAENQERVLVWGGIFGTDKKFQEEVRPLRPIETKVDDKEIITTDSRNLYRDYIFTQLPRLAEIVLAKWQVDVRDIDRGDGGSPSGGAGGLPGSGSGSSTPGGTTGGGGMAGMPGGGGAKAAEDDDPSVVVIWNPSNQKEIVQTHFNLATSQSIPSTLEVLYAQEDLWVFENLMNIIRATNEGAVRKHEANIRYIDYVRIGKSAGDVTGQITLLGNNNSSSSGVGGMPGMPGGAAGGMPGMPAGAGGGMPGMPTAAAGGTTSGGAPSPGGTTGGSGPPGTGGAGTMPGMPGGGGSGGAKSSAALASGRYVDLNYKSIVDINVLRNAMKGTGTKEDMLLAVSKRMPVRMQFKMDQRKLTTLLAECGNSKLPVEVRQVRIKNSLGGSESSSGVGGGMPGSSSSGSGGGMPMPGGMSGGPGAVGGSGSIPGFSGGGGSGQGNAKPASIASSKTDPNEITVEIYGIVYIYNPPDRKLLGIPEPAGTTLPGPTTTPTSTTPPMNAGAATGR